MVMEKSIGIYLTYCFMALIALNAVRALVRGEYNAMVTAVLMLALTVIPFIVVKRMTFAGARPACNSFTMNSLVQRHGCKRQC